MSDTGKNDNTLAIDQATYPVANQTDDQSAGNINERESEAKPWQLPKDEYNRLRQSRKGSNSAQGRYPTSRVITLYLFFGGAVGGALIGLLLLLLTGELAAVLFILVGMILGLGLGLIPATLTGIFAAYFELVREPKDLAWVTLVGAFITVIYTLIAIVMMGEAMNVSGVSVMAALLGGLSALVTGLLTLPKPSELIIGQIPNDSNR